MALQFNLLHEELAEARQRKRDPLKLGLMALGALGAILFLYYGWNAYQTLQIRSQLRAAQGDWDVVEPKVTAAQKRADELRKIIDSTKVLDAIIDGRFYWAPFLGSSHRPFLRTFNSSVWMATSIATMPPSRFCSKASAPRVSHAPPPRIFVNSFLSS